MAVRRIMNDCLDNLLLVFLSVSPVSTVQRVRRQFCLEDGGEENEEDHEDRIPSIAVLTK